MPLDPGTVVPFSLGMVIGMVMGLTGAGGGVLAVPLLVYILGMTVQSAAPIGLLAVGLAASLGAILGLKAGEVRYKAAALMGTIGLLTSPIGFWAAGLTDTRVLSALFATVLVWVAYNAFRYRPTHGLVEIDTPHEDAKSKCPCLRNPATGRFVWTWPCARALASSGALAGFMSGLLGVGGGFVLVPALQRFTNLTLQSVTVTSLAVIAIVSMFGVGNSLSSGVFDLQLGLAFSGGAMAGMLAGRLVSDNLPIHYLKKSFALVCLTVAALMVSKALG